MTDFTLTTPIVLVVFNRPETTASVFAAIREASPRQLLLVADGPRPERQNDFQKCAEVRAIIEQIDWPCEVLRNYSESNLGCKLRVSSGLDWVFSQVEEAIIMEDDCLPDPTFFRFCQEMLGKYRNNSCIASIGGSNYLFGSLDLHHSYYFSQYNHIWGWASWRRAWLDYDVHMTKWPSVRDTDWLSNIFLKRVDTCFWNVNFAQVYCGKLDTWDLQWTFACWLNNRLSIIPCVNLVSNIGFGPEATHTKNNKCRVANLRNESIGFPLLHPDDVHRNSIADAFTQKTIFRQGIIKTMFNVLKYFLMRYK